MGFLFIRKRKSCNSYIFYQKVALVCNAENTYIIRCIIEWVDAQHLGLRYCSDFSLRIFFIQKLFEDSRNRILKALPKNYICKLLCLGMLYSLYKSLFIKIFYKEAESINLTLYSYRTIRGVETGKRPMTITTLKAQSDKKFRKNEFIKSSPKRRAMPKIYCSRGQGGTRY